MVVPGLGYLFDFGGSSSTVTCAKAKEWHDAAAWPKDFRAFIAEHWGQYLGFSLDRSKCTLDKPSECRKNTCSYFPDEVFAWPKSQPKRNLVWEVETSAPWKERCKTKADVAAFAAELKQRLADEKKKARAGMKEDAATDVRRLAEAKAAIKAAKLAKKTAKLAAKTQRLASKSVVADAKLAAKTAAGGGDKAAAKAAKKELKAAVKAEKAKLKASKKECSVAIKAAKADLKEAKLQVPFCRAMALLNKETNQKVLKQIGYVGYCLNENTACYKKQVKEWAAEKAAAAQP